MAAPTISVEDARSRLSYDHATGTFTRLVSHGPKPVFLRETKKGYLKIDLMGRRYFAHRLAWYLHYGEWPETMIDHINGDRGDNKIANLRLADAAQNAANAKRYASNTTGFKGVTERRPGEFRARIHKNGKPISLGTFSTPEDAHAAYLRAANDLYGEFTRAA